MAVSLSRDGALGFIILDRPPANSYNLEFVQELSSAVDDASADETIRVVIVKSASDKFFSAGADVKSFAENSYEANMLMIQAEHMALERIEETPKLFIAMIAGHCLGGGLEIALACDLRFAGEGDYKIGLPEVTLGLQPGSGGTQRLPRLIGKSRALDMMVTGRTVSPQQALELGVFDRLFPKADLADETANYARSLAGGAMTAMGAIKRSVNLGVEMPLHEALAFERVVTAELFKSEDSKEGITAFAEKRKPVFRGK